jgi:hypothetical protein
MMIYLPVTSFAGDLGACPITSSQALELRDQQRQKMDTKPQETRDDPQGRLPLKKVSIPQHVNGMARWAKGSLDQ